MFCSVSLNRLCRPLNVIVPLPVAHKYYNIYSSIYFAMMAIYSLDNKYFMPFFFKIEIVWCAKCTETGLSGSQAEIKPLVFALGFHCSFRRLQSF